MKSCLLFVCFKFLFSSVKCYENQTSTRWPLYKEHYDFIPKPRWSQIQSQVIFNSSEECETFRNALTDIHNGLLNVSYNSVSSLIRFYNDYKLNEEKYKGNLRKFYFDYQPLVKEDHLNCVGLTIELKKRCVRALKKEFPNIDKALFYSAGEVLLSAGNDLLTRRFLRGDEQWKHVGLAMKFKIKNRTGYFLIDQSFGTPVVTLMKDGLYPHRAHFKANHNYSVDNYTYSLTNNGFVNFTRITFPFLNKNEKVTYGGFYLGHNLDSILDLTEKRAIIKQKRSIVQRTPDIRRLLDTDVLIHNGTCIDVYQEGKYFPQMRWGKIYLDKTNLSHPWLGLPNITLNKIKLWNSMFGFKEGTFFEMIRNLSILSQDVHFLRQIRILDPEINTAKRDYFAMSPEYDSGSMNSGTSEILYDSFVKMLHNLSSFEIRQFGESQKTRQNTPVRKQMNQTARNTLPGGKTNTRITFLPQDLDIPF